MDIGQVITSVASTLNDPGYVRWSVADLVDFLNDACLQVVVAKHSANPVTKVVTLSEGTRQTLPADAIGLIEVQRNVPSGRAVRFIHKETIDAASPLWHSASRQVDARDYTFDPRDPKTFWVYPPAHSTSKLEILYGARPSAASVPDTPGTDPWDPLPLDPEYAEPIRLWMLYRAYLQDTGASSAQKASGYFKQFNAWLGLETQARVSADPQAGAEQ